jgi:hypothetical protein
MTNKTVTMSWELVERILKQLDYAATMFKAAKTERNELRALLTKPAPLPNRYADAAYCEALEQERDYLRSQLVKPATQHQGEPEFMKPQYLSVPGLWIKCAEDDIGAQRFYRHPAERLAIAEKRNAELESKLLKLSDFARFVIKCVRRNGEYAPLSMQEPDEIKALLAKSTESGASHES